MFEQSQVVQSRCPIEAVAKLEGVSVFDLQASGKTIDSVEDADMAPCDPWPLMYRKIIFMLRACQPTEPRINPGLPAPQRAAPQLHEPGTIPCKQINEPSIGNVTIATQLTVSTPNACVHMSSTHSDVLIRWEGLMEISHETVKEHQIQQGSGLEILEDAGFSTHSPRQHHKPRVASKPTRRDGLCYAFTLVWPKTMQLMCQGTPTPTRSLLSEVFFAKARSESCHLLFANRWL